jgi:hypothetical protein
VNIVLAGVMGRYPYGGVAWCSLMYLIEFMRLGHRVWYLEDMGECNFDPVRNTLSKDPAYALGFIRTCLEPHGLGERWCYVDWQGNYHGMGRREWLDVCAGADLFINLSGGCAFWRDEYARIPHSAYIDTDPVFTQMEAARRPERRGFLAQHGTHFTFGRNLGTPECDAPTLGLTWEHTWQPVSVDLWRPTGEAPRQTFTTVMSWAIESFQEIGGNKDVELTRLIDLPAHVSTPLELAVSGPKDLLSRHGWRCLDAFSVSHSAHAYREYIASSMGEFSVAKSTYVLRRSGWFSDRTACYLASGRPAVVQDTGFSAHLPVGEGLCAYSTLDEARHGLESVARDYGRHAAAAREVAEACFSGQVVIPPLLERATGGAGPKDPAAPLTSEAWRE